MVSWVRIPHPPPSTPDVATGPVLAVWVPDASASRRHGTRDARHRGRGAFAVAPLARYRGHREAVADAGGQLKERLPGGFEEAIEVDLGALLQVRVVRHADH